VPAFVPKLESIALYFLLLYKLTANN